MILSGALLIIAAIFLGEFWQLRSDKLLIRLRRAVAVILLVYGVILIIGGAKGNTSFLSPLASQAAQQEGVDLPFQHVKTIADVEAAVMNAKGKPVLLDFYADWCFACKEMDATTFANPQVKSTLSHFVLLRANVTNNDRFDQALEKHYGVVAPPTFVFFDKQGHWLQSLQLVGSTPTKAFDRHLMIVLTR